MSDIDDWEQMDSDEDDQKKKEEEEKKKKQFEDEDKVDTQKKEAARKAKIAEEQKKLQEDARVKDSKKVDYDKKFAERQMALGGTGGSKVDTTGMTDKQKAFALQIEAEGQNVDQLFGDMDGQKGQANVQKVNLSTEKGYREYGKSTSKILFDGPTPYHVDKFYHELSKDLPNHCDSKQIKKIIDHLQILFNGKQKEEKEARDGKNKKQKKAALKSGGGKGYEMNNNPAMINDVMGTGANDANDDYGDYGDEKEAFHREGEAEYDFM